MMNSIARTVRVSFVPLVAKQPRRGKGRWIAKSLGVLFCLAVSISRGEDWPQFLGPARTGISSDTQLVDSLEAPELTVAWKVPGGVGMSAVAVKGNDAITLWNSDENQLLVALDATTGENRWSTIVGRRYENSMGDGPRATPTISDDVVFAYTGEGMLVAVDLKTGKLIWQANVVQDSGGLPSDYGMSSSPLVVEGRVIVHGGGPQSAISAYDAKTGDRSWSASSGPAGYASPMLLPIGQSKQVVSFVGAGLIGIDPIDGTVLWTYPFQTPYDCNTASPIAVDGGVFISAGENHGSALLEIVRESDQYRVQERWSSLDVKSVMRNEWQTSVLLDGYLYGFDNVGSAGPVTHLTCIDARTGQRVWQETRFGKGNLTLADGKLWITTMDGELVLARATPEGYQELGRRKLFGKTRQSLSIANGHGYIRDDAHVVCLRLKKSSASDN